MTHNPDQPMTEADSTSREWMATLDELTAMPANAWAEALAACPADNAHPLSNPAADEDQLRMGIEKLSSIYG
ncbi:MAG: hypothetical protein QOG62_2711 [Thermoleophilaceae bacterium]|jgi:hypothetical protein|nr:hypothetical protein [Thermoleophilaceae bacterium]